jgi:hypothetical protein
VTEENESPEDETIEQETATPLPERDAMSIIGGPEKLIPVDGPPKPLDPTPSEPTPIKISPPLQRHIG